MTSRNAAFPEKAFITLNTYDIMLLVAEKTEPDRLAQL
jgi:hypothetical protein